MPGFKSALNYLEDHLDAEVTRHFSGAKTGSTEHRMLASILKPHLRQEHIDCYKSGKLYKWIENTIRRRRSSQQKEENMAIPAEGQGPKHDNYDQRCGSYDDLFNILDHNPSALQIYLRQRPVVCNQLGIRLVTRGNGENPQESFSASGEAEGNAKTVQAKQVVLKNNDVVLLMGSNSLWLAKYRGGAVGLFLCKYSAGCPVRGVDLHKDDSRLVLEDSPVPVSEVEVICVVPRSGRYGWKGNRIEPYCCSEFQEYLSKKWQTFQAKSC